MKKIVLFFIAVGVCFILVPQALADLDDGLVAYYPFNGNANDESGNGNHGTVFGATLTADRFGEPNSAYEFDGLDYYIDCGNSEQFIMTGKSFTISAWVKTTDWHGSIVTKHDGYRTGEWVHCIVNARLRFGGSQDGKFRDTNATISDGKWHHLVGAIVHNGPNDNDLYQYIDGKFDGTLRSIPDIDSGNRHVLIGNENNLDHDYEGLIDDIRIYNRALSESEIQQLYEYSEPSLPELLERIETLELQIEDLTQNVIDLQGEIEEHDHTYLTGKGVGHNNTEAKTGPATFPVAP